MFGRFEKKDLKRFRFFFIDKKHLQRLFKLDKLQDSCKLTIQIKNMVNWIKVVNVNDFVII